MSSRCHLIVVGLVLFAGIWTTAQAPAGPFGERPVFLVGKLPADVFIEFSTNLAVAGERNVLLLDSPKNRTYLKAFLQSYKPTALVLVGGFAEPPTAVERALELRDVKASHWPKEPTLELWKTAPPRGEELVVVGAGARRALLQAACLAGASKAPLYVIRSELNHKALADQVAAGKTKRIHAVGDQAAQVSATLKGVEVKALLDERSLSAVFLQVQQKAGPIGALVVANPSDADQAEGKNRLTMSSLAPWVAIQLRGHLLLTGKEGTNATALLRATLKEPAFQQVENLILVADLAAIPTEKRPNPVAGKDEKIEFDPPGPDETGLFTFAAGRLFHEDPSVVTLMLARQRLLAEAKGPRKALIVSNPGGGLPLLETISRNTAHELRNAGYDATALFGGDADAAKLRKALPEQDIFLWEGHHSTLVQGFGVPSWPEPMRPSLVFLQSCLALTETEAAPFLQRGAVGVIGSSSRTYSATGGATTLGFFDALAYDHQSLGGGLRQAKNFLVAYEQLKIKRLGDDQQLKGASVRSAWAFTLWGDPTVKLPAPPPPAKAMGHVQAAVKGKRITLTVPETLYEPTQTEKYSARIWPNGRLAGYVTKAETDGRRRLIPLLFAEVLVPGAAGKPAPKLTSKVPEDHWAFAWDARRGAGYLVLLPRNKDRKEVRWEME